MKQILKFAAVAFGLVSMAAAPAWADRRGHHHADHDDHGARRLAYVQVYHVPHGDWLNVRGYPSPRGPVVGRLWNDDEAVVDLGDCWDARWNERVPAWQVNFSAPALWCGIRAGHHGALRGYVRTTFIR